MSATRQLTQLMNTTRNKIMVSLHRWANNSNTQELGNTNNLRLSLHILLKPLNWESELCQPFICCYELFTHSHSLFQRGDRPRLFYIKYICVHTMQQAFSHNICVTRLNIIWCLIMSSQYLLSTLTPFFTYHLNCNISILTIANLTRPGTINRFLTILKFWIKRWQGKRFKDLLSSSCLGLENCTTYWSGIRIIVFTQQQLLN